MANIKWSAFTDGGEMQVNDQTVGLRAGDNYRFDFPGTGFKDASGNYLVGYTSAGALSVNYIQFNSAIAGSAPFITSAGIAADIGLLLKSKGNSNITLTPGGLGTIVASSALILSTSSPSTALEAASKGYVDSLLPAYPIPLNLGGTNASLTASNGGIFYSTATAGAILSGTIVANRVLLSGLSSAPSWSTAVYPATTTVNEILYSGTANVISGITTTNNGLLITSNTGVPSLLPGSGVTGNMLRSNSSAPPSWSTAIFADTYAVNTLLYAATANSVSGLATANNGVLITSAGGVPSIASTLPSAVQSNITTVGTVSSGAWNASLITGTYGGTGINNGASTITIGGSFAMSGAFTFAGTLTGNTAVTFPTSGTLATTSQIPSLPLSLTNGGTNASLAASNGGIVYSGATAFAVLSGTATAGQLLMSGSMTTPTWSTTTYPATNAINTIMYASSANVLGSIAAANNGILVTSAGGVPSIGNTVGAGLTMPSITFNSTTGIIGTTTNNSAPAGSVGYFVQQNVVYASRVSFSGSDTATNIASLSLPAGDWDVWGNVSVETTGLAAVRFGWISSASATFPDVSMRHQIAVSTTIATITGFAIASQRFSLSGTTTVYLTGAATFTGGTANGCGNLYARVRR